MDHLGTLVQAFLKHAVEGLAVEAGFSLVVGRLETNQVEGVKGNFVIVMSLLKKKKIHGSWIRWLPQIFYIASELSCSFKDSLSS